jgi:hypothetical protein
MNSDNFYEVNNTADYLGLIGEDRDLFIDKPHQFIKALLEEISDLDRKLQSMEARIGELEYLVRCGKEEEL